MSLCIYRKLVKRMEEENEGVRNQYQSEEVRRESWELTSMRMNWKQLIRMRKCQKLDHDELDS